MPKAPVTRKTRSLNGNLGMLGSGTPVSISPTTATPWADRSRAAERRMPTTSATSAPGIRGATRLRITIPTRDPTPRMAVAGVVRATVSGRCRHDLLDDRPTDRRDAEEAGQLADGDRIARPMTKPVTTDAARNCDRKPSRAAPATIRMRPTMRASAALEWRRRPGSPASHRPHDGGGHDRDRRAGGDLQVARRPKTA